VDAPLNAADGDDPEIERLLEAIHRRYQHDFRQYSRSSMCRRVRRAMDAFGCASVSQLQDRVVHDAATLPRLLDFLTVQVSDMFRDPAYFAALRREVLPMLATWPSLKVWVAGCSTGEELWSLLIVFREEGLLERTVFYATDINPAALRQAESGVYDLDRMAGFSTHYHAAGGRASLADYYTVAYGRALFDRSLRVRAVFADHSLATDGVFSETHLVSCRNVLIYFNRPLQDRALGLFRDSLVPGGYLGLGARETARFSSHAAAFEPVAAAERVFRRRHEPGY
jgi:chemotaxis protein methyltransferase CheR